MIFQIFFRRDFQNVNFYFVDQFDCVKSGPGVFVDNLLKINQDSGLRIIFVSHDIKNKAPDRIKLPSIPFNGKIFTFFNMFSYSIAFFFLRLFYPNNKYFVNSHYLIFFSFWIGKFILFINDSKAIESKGIGYYLFRIVCKFADKHIFNSKHHQNKIHNELNLNVDSFVLNKSVSFNSNFNSKKKLQDPFIISFMKNDWKFGNLEKVLDWLEKVENFSFIFRIIGISNPKENELLYLLNKCTFKERVELYGVLPNQIVIDLLSESSIFVNFCPHEYFGVASFESVYSKNLLVTCDDDCGLVSLMKEFSFGLIVKNEQEFIHLVDKFSHIEWDGKINSDIANINKNLGYDIFKNNVKNIFIQ